MQNLLKKSDALVILSPSNLFYLTGYRNTDACVVIAKNKRYYISDGRVAEEFKSINTGYEFIDFQGLGYARAARKLLNTLGIRSLGYENLSVTHRAYRELTQGIRSYRMVQAEELLQSARAVKTEKELALIRRAQAITDKVYSELLKFVKPGIAEVDLAAFMNSKIYGYGGELAFETIAAFGSNTSRPHAHPGERVLGKNDVITVDFGAKFGGYCSDMTRSFVIGEPPKGYESVYNAVLTAQTTALNTLKAGMTGSECDAVARASIEKSGYGGLFTHSLGHSLGIDIHESPSLSASNTEPIPVGAVTSVEPGIYIQGKYGVRIEDIVVFQKNTVDNLTKSPKKLIIV